MSPRRKRKPKLVPKRVGRSSRRAQRRRLRTWGIPFSLVLLLVVIVAFCWGFFEG